MIHKLLIPTVQYGNIEFQFEGSAEEAVTEYMKLQKFIKEVMKQDW